MTELKYTRLIAAAGAFAMTTGAAVAQNFVTDVTIQGSLCVGIDCSTGESFGFDTIRLKENNLRIKFQDTSTTASFPGNDWSIEANDSSNGGANYLRFLDVDAGRAPFTVEAGAQANTLYVEDDGDVGIKTSTPVVDLHIVEGNTPTVRLDQDGSDGFQSQIWDLAGNESNFFVRDVTNASKLPFRIQPNAPTDSIYVASDGDIGFGTDSPTDDLQIVRSTGSVGIRLQTGDSPEIFRMALNSSLDKFVLNFDDAVGPDFTLDVDGNIEIRGNLITTGGGGACTVADPCDAVFDPELYTVRPMEDYAAFMWANKHLPSVGPTGADAPINMTEKMLRMLNALEHAHIYIDQLNTELKTQSDEIATLRAEIETLK